MQNWMIQEWQLILKCDSFLEIKTECIRRLLRKCLAIFYLCIPYLLMQNIIITFLPLENQSQIVQQLSLKHPMKEQIRQSSQRRNFKISRKRQVIDFIKKEKEKKKIQRSSRKDPNKVGFSVGEWTRREIGLYIKYILAHKAEFVNPTLRKKKKVFIKLAHFIGSRTADQCRSHHQKVSLKFEDIGQQIQFYQRELEQNLEQKRQNQIQSDLNNQVDAGTLKEQQKSLSQDKFEENSKPNIFQEQCRQGVDLTIRQKSFNNQQNENSMLLLNNKKENDRKTAEVMEEQPYDIELEENIMKIRIKFNIIDEFQ